MRLDDLLAQYRPGSYDPPWSWRDEADDIANRKGAYLDALITSIQENGMRQPIVLGDDGRIWDGHHRVVAAIALALDVVPTRGPVGA